MKRQWWILIIIVVSGVWLLNGCTAPPETAVTEPTVVPTAAVPVAVEPDTAEPDMVEPDTPAEVVARFYNWYVAYVNETGNPLVDKAYHDSPNLAAAWVQQVDDIVAGFDRGGYDPFLCAQDAPAAFEATATAVSNDTAELILQQVWNPDSEYEMVREVTVRLQASNGSWLISEVVCPSPPAEEVKTADLSTPAGVVQAFYDWYLAYIGDRASGEFNNPLVDKAYYDSPYLTAEFAQYVDDLVASFEGGGYDPILCAQDIPDEISTDVTFLNGETPQVLVRTSLWEHAFTLLLEAHGDTWLINGVQCRIGPVGAATGFYTWYLAHVADPPAGMSGNLLVDGSYDQSGFLTDAFVRRVNEIVAGFDQGGYDPFLLAQDAPQSFTVMGGVTMETAVVSLQFGPDFSKEILVTADPVSYRLIDDVSELDAPVWEWYTDAEYGFTFPYPAGWVLEELDQDVPGMPDDWPTVRVMQIMPPDVAEQLAARSGPPDPEAPIIVAPFLLEITVGDQAAFDRVYPVVESRLVLIGKNRAIVRWNEPGYRQYVFQHPADDSVWLVFTDWVSEFPGREEQAAVVRGILGTILSGLAYNNIE